MKGLSFLKKNKAEECTVEGNKKGLNVVSYYDEFLTEFIEDTDDIAEVDHLVNLIELALGKQGISAEDSPAKEVEDAVVDLMKARIHRYVSENEQEIKDENVVTMSEEYNAMQNIMVTVLSCFCDNHSELSFYRIMTELINTRADEYEVPWSFDSFGDLIATKWFMNSDTSELRELWEEYFEMFLGCADKNSLRTLKMGIGELDDENSDYWADKLYEYLKESENVGTHRASFLIDEVLEVFPEMANLVLEGMLDEMLDEVEFDDITIAQLIALMAEYQEYLLHFFPSCHRYYDLIIEIAMTKTNVSGLELTEIAEYLANTFKVPVEKIEEEICRNVAELLGVTKSTAGNADADNIHRVVQLLSNKTVFNMVAEYNYSVIQQFA